MINNENHNQQISFLFQLDYYVFVSLCSICSLICFLLILLIIKKCIRSIKAFFGFNMCILLILFDTIDSYPKFTFNSDNKICLVLGSARIVIKNYILTSCLILFIYSYIILVKGAKKKNEIKKTFIVVIFLLWIICISLGITIYFYGESNVNQLNECGFDSLKFADSIYRLVNSVFQVISMALIYRILIKEEIKDKYEYYKVKKLLWLGIGQIIILGIRFFDSFFNDTIKRNYLFKLIPRCIEYIYNIIFIIIIFYTKGKWKVIKKILCCHTHNTLTNSMQINSLNTLFEV